MGKNGQQGDIHVQLTAGDEASPVVVRSAEKQSEALKKTGQQADVLGQKMAQASEKSVRGIREMTRAQAVAAREQVREYERVLRSQEYRRAELIPSVVRPSAPRPSIARAEWYDVSPRPLQGGQRGRDAVRAAVIERNAAEMDRLAPLTEYATAESMRTQQYAMYGGKAEASAELHRRQAEQEARRQREADITQAFSDREEAQKANAAWMRTSRNTNADLQEQQVAELVSARQKLERQTDMAIAEQEYQADRRSYAEKERNAEKQIAWKKRYYDESMRAIAAENKITGAVKEQEAAFGRLNRAKGGGFFKGGWDQALSHIGAIGLGFGGIGVVSSGFQSVREGLDKQAQFEDTMTKVLSLEDNMDKRDKLKSEVLSKSTAYRTTPEEVASFKYNLQSNAANIPAQEQEAIANETLLLKQAQGVPLESGAKLGVKTWLHYGKEVGSVPLMYSKLMKTADVGAIEPEVLANLLPDILPSAKISHKSLDEVGALVAAGTQLGGTDEKSMTGIRTVFARLSKAKIRGTTLQQLEQISRMSEDEMFDVFGQEGVTTAGALSSPEGREIFKSVLAQMQAVKGSRSRDLIAKRMTDPAYRYAEVTGAVKQSIENAPMSKERSENLQSFDKRYQIAKRGYVESAPMALKLFAGPAAFLDAAGMWMYDKLGIPFDKMSPENQKQVAPNFLIGKQVIQDELYSGGRGDLAQTLDRTSAENQKYFEGKVLDAGIAEGQAKLDLMAQEALTQSNGDLRGSVDNLRVAVDANTAAMAIGDLAAGREPTTVQGMRSAKQDREATLEMNRRGNEAYWKSQERIRNRREGVVEASYAVGTDYVPRDMVAQLHKGEGVLTAQENANFRAWNGGPGVEDNYSLNAGAAKYGNANFRAWNGGPGVEDNYSLNAGAAIYGNANSRAWGGANGPMSNSGVWNSGGVGFAQMGGGSGTIPGIDELIGGVRELNGNIVSLGRRMDALGGKMERGNVSPRVPPVSRGAMRGE